jgi:hypothetical protein
MKKIVSIKNVQYFIDKAIYGNTDRPYFVEQDIKHCKNNEIIYIPIVCMQNIIDNKRKNVKQFSYTKKEIIDFIKSEYNLNEKQIYEYNLIEKFLYLGCGEDIYYIYLVTTDYNKPNYEFKTIDSLDINELWELRKQIVLNSMYYSDYYNDYRICTHTAINFFDCYLDYLCNTENWKYLKLNENCQIPTDDNNIIEIINCFDNKDNLYWFKTYEYNV